MPTPSRCFDCDSALTKPVLCVGRTKVENEGFFFQAVCLYDRLTLFCNSTFFAHSANTTTSPKNLLAVDSGGVTTSLHLVLSYTFLGTLFEHLPARSRHI